MYELSESLAKANDIFWTRLAQRLRSKGVDVPDRLERDVGELEGHWSDGRVLLSQACGYPYVTILNAKGVKLVATPVYSTNGHLPEGYYESVIIVPAGSDYKDLRDLKGKKAAFNQSHSNSGMNVFRAAIASSFDRETLQAGIFAEVVETGGHLTSVRKVAAGEVDVAAIDSVTYDLIRENYPELSAKTRVLMRSPSSPGLPLITGAGTSDRVIEKLRASLQEVVRDETDSDLAWALDQMKLTGFTLITEETYEERIRGLEKLAEKKAYLDLK